MAMLRVSSYRKLFEDESWSRDVGLSSRCAGRYRASARDAAVHKRDCINVDFEASKALNKEGLSRFVQERSSLASLNDRLVQLIELAHCFEEENKALESEIAELDEVMNNKQTSGKVSAVPDYSLDAVVEKLRRQKDEILGETEELTEELERVCQEYEKVAHQRILIQQEQRGVSEEVNAVTAECLALREQVSIYEEQLTNMEAKHRMEVESLLNPDERTLRAAVITFGSPDITPALDVKEFYQQLAESLQFEGSTSSSAVARRGDGNRLEGGGAEGSRVKNLPEIKDVSEMNALISELIEELTDLEKRNEELEEEAEIKTTAYMDEVAELECSMEELRQQEADLKSQMKEQCEEYKELLKEKMARHMEIAAYRSLVEEEEDRLCCL
ncbi:vimentin [Nothobranchius furzeri]|uniref:Vimentin-like n=3 Tax=Nothobranchius TaxID=28779 RepID=A0A8C6K6I4_NOTFU|nr:vimentin-like [Nothobranchius furzeri]